MHSRLLRVPSNETVNDKTIHIGDQVVGKWGTLANITHMLRGEQEGGTKRYGTTSFPTRYHRLRKRTTSFPRMPSRRSFLAAGRPRARSTAAWTCNETCLSQPSQLFANPVPSFASFSGVMPLWRSPSSTRPPVLCDTSSVTHATALDKKETLKLQRMYRQAQGTQKVTQKGNVTDL